MRREKSYTVAQAPGGGAVAITFPVTYADQAALEIETWRADAGGGVIFLFGGRLSTAQCAAALAEEGDVNGGASVDCICAVPRAGTARVPASDMYHNLTVYFSTGETGDTPTVCVKLIEHTER